MPPVPDFFGSFNKGSKSCRTFLGKAQGNSYDVNKIPSILTFFTLIQLDIPDASTIGNFLSLWNLSFIPNKLRDFIFKFYNNRLGINTRTSHFGSNTRNCTFCTILGTPSRDESFIHLFLECEVVTHNQNSLDRNLFNFSNDDILDKKVDGLAVRSLIGKIFSLEFSSSLYNIISGMLNWEIFCCRLILFLVKQFCYWIMLVASTKNSKIVELYLTVLFLGTGAIYGLWQGAGDGQHRGSPPGAEEPGGGGYDGAQIFCCGWADQLRGRAS